MAEAEEGLPPGFHDQPMLMVDPGRHTGTVWCADMDAAGRFAATSSEDKTVRVWSLADGALLRTIRLPAGQGNVGMAFAVAIDPAGGIIAVGGWTSKTEASPSEGIYLYDCATGELRQRLGGLPNVVRYLVFSPDGRYLAATIHGTNGLRVFGRDESWAEVARDANYRGPSYGAAFALDGRLATTSLDGLVRLYGSDFRLRESGKPPGGVRPYGIAFNLDGTRLAIGYDDSTAVDVLDGNSLAPLYSAPTADITNGDLSRVAWAADGTLLAAGGYEDSTGLPVLAWATEGRGARRSLPAVRNRVTSLRPLPDGDLLVVAGGPWLGRLTAAGRAVWTLPPPLADLRGQHSTLAVAADGAKVDFAFEERGRTPSRFDLGCLTLTLRSPTDNRTAPPQHQGLPVASWRENEKPTLSGAPLLLDPFEASLSLALHSDGGRFILGTSWSLRAFNVAGAPLWHQSAPGDAWAVNITGDGRLVVAAYGDGTIRWHRMDDGREILAFMPIADRRNWVVWTPEGVYAASPGGHGLLVWHVNQPNWQPAKEYAVASIPGFYRPEAIKLILQEMETPRAIGLAVLAEQRERVRLVTNSRVPPGARLHLLAIGVSRYNQAHLRLNFAQQDAYDVVSALSSTQEALWIAGTRQYLADADASRRSIRRALETLRQAMRVKDDLAVVLFSGHGAMVDGELYLLPEEVQAGDVVALKETALPVADLRRELLRIAEGGRVLLLLDACYSGGASLDGHAQLVASSSLSTAVAAANISVLASSSTDQPSREHADWQNGAFTEAFLEALGAADEDKDGLISATELARYLDRRVRNLTDGKQQPAMELRFDGTLFAVR